MPFRTFATIIVCILSLVCAAPARAICPPDIAPPGGNGVVNVDDLLAVITTWGPCPAPCPVYCNADINHNCAVTVDDLLAVITGWGACPCTPDAFEPDNDCSHVSTLATVGSDQTQTYSNMNLAGLGDVDFYRLPCHETDSTCYCGFPYTDEDYIIKVTLSVPASAAGPYQFCMNVNTCSWPSGYCFNVAPGTSLMLSIQVDGSCPGEDNYDAYVRISPTVPSANECVNYTLTYFFDAGYCF